MYMPISIVLGVVSCENWYNSRPCWQGQGLKVTVYGINQEGTCNFILVVNSNLTRFLSYDHLLAKMKRVRLSCVI